MKYLSFKYIILASFGFAIALSACNKDPNVKNEYEDWKNPDNANTGGGPELDVNSIQGIHFPYL